MIAGSFSKTSARDMQMIETISIVAGYGRCGRPDAVERIDMSMGQLISVVGPTGSGKTTLINDIELFANRDTPSRRRILINGAPAPREFRNNPARNPIALITQHTTFLSDMPVRRFLMAHSSVRTGTGEDPELVAETIDFANQLTGEPIDLASRMTELSGGQTRALLIADATVICSTPVVLLDEVENAGINRTRAMQLLRRHRKIFIFVTHDPRIALLSDYRIIMQQGRIVQKFETSAEEQTASRYVNRLDESLTYLRERLRQGHRLIAREIQEVA
jgi:ABC-type lipoprotein export system ATPase subunit